MYDIRAYIPFATPGLMYQPHGVNSTYQPRSAATCGAEGKKGGGHVDSKAPRQQEMV
jgi:hypothetical protein